MKRKASLMEQQPQLYRGELRFISHVQIFPFVDAAQSCRSFFKLSPAIGGNL